MNILTAKHDFLHMEIDLVEDGAIRLANTYGEIVWLIPKASAEYGLLVNALTEAFAQHLKILEAGPDA